MKFLKFTIENYRGINNKIVIDLKKNTLIPLIGINECGKTTILQAIYSFDYVNDEEYEKRHITDTHNLYKTSTDKPPLISAEIEISKNELEKVIEEYNQTQTEEDSKIDHKLANRVKESSITIQRNLESLKYSILDEELADLDVIVEDIIKETPYILYNDDFMDRPPNEIEIPEKKPETLSGWIAIYERLFNTTNKNYSLFSLIKETDARRRSSILSDVEELLNGKLGKAWKTFLLSNHKALKVKFDLDINGNSKKLKINIVEKRNKKDRFFDVADRSKGFLWFFNFVMKLEFNPKVIGNTKDTIFLLDEPGSYLHSSAQEKLCEKLKDISDKSGNVIYCTHSHHLLNPNYIPLNKIYIVEKENNKNIKATPLPQVKSKKENLTAHQPILDALHIPNVDLYNNSKSIIAVEGINDKYSIRLFCDLEKDVSILPGRSADSIVKNIQFLNGFSKAYVAIWDNDGEGRKQYDIACKTYGEFEARKFDKLPKGDRANRKMEHMYENGDLSKIGNHLGLPSDANYNKIIATLFHSETEKKDRVKNLLSEKTKENFKILADIISKRMQKSRNLEQE